MFTFQISILFENSQIHNKQYFIKKNIRFTLSTFIHSGNNTFIMCLLYFFPFFQVSILCIVSDILPPYCTLSQNTGGGTNTRKKTRNLKLNFLELSRKENCVFWD